jgi:hypothetical protein
VVLRAGEGYVFRTLQNFQYLPLSHHRDDTSKFWKGLKTDPSPIHKAYQQNIFYTLYLHSWEGGGVERPPPLKRSLYNVPYYKYGTELIKPPISISCIKKKT